MSNQRITIEVKQGTAWKASIQIKNAGSVRSLAGYTAKMQIRKEPGAPVIAELSTENGLITVDSVENKIDVKIPAAMTSAFTFVKAEFDMFVIPPDSDPENILEGTVSLVKSITVL